MTPKPNRHFIDKHTSIDDLLAILVEQNDQMLDLMAGGGDVQDVFVLSYPYDATYLTIAAGTTIFDFDHGTVNAPGAAIANMSSSLRVRKEAFMRSLVIDSNKDTVLQLDGQDKMIVHAGRWLFPNKQFGTVQITTTENTEVFVVASTHPNMVDSAGEFVIRGNDSGTLRTVAVDENGNMVTLMKGDDGANLQTIKVDATGQMYVAMTGQSLSVDNHPSDYLKAGESVGVNNHPSDYFKADESAVMKGDDAGTKRLVAVDTSGIMLSRMKGAYGATLKDILLDDTGIMLSRMKGSFGGTLKDIGVDTNGNMISIMKGAAGNNVAVDASGYLTSVIRGSVGAISQDASGNLVSAMKGLDGVNIRDIAVDASGQMISIMKGAAGNNVAVDASGYLAASMKGLEGANVRDIAVDANGNMISVMKGNYGGVLKTWKVDTDGRGEMFLNDPTDVWGTINPMGLGEAMVRSHAPPMVHDKRGNVVRWIDFESATPNYSVAVSGTPTHGRSTDTAFNGDNSYKCVLAQYDQVVLTQSTNDYSEANMRGASVMFASADSDFWIQLEVRSWDANNNAYKWVRLRFDLSTGNIIIYNDLNFYVIDTVNYYSNIYNFSTLKLVTDLSGQKYTRATVFGVEYDLSAYSTGLSLTPGTQRLDAIVTVDNQAAGTNTVYLDNIILTENEPGN